MIKRKKVRVCNVTGCGRRANPGTRYQQGWEETGEFIWGIVCASCDRALGLKNLVAAGYTFEEAYAVNDDIIYAQDREMRKPRDKQRHPTKLGTFGIGRAKV